MALHLTEDSIIRVAPLPVGNAAPVWATVLNIDSFDVGHGGDEDEEHYWFGTDEPDVFAGDDEDTYSISGGLNMADATGQATIRTALRNKTAILLQVLTNGVVGEQQKARPRSFNYSGERNGDKYVAATFEFRGYGAITDVDTSAP